LLHKALLITALALLIVSLPIANSAAHTRPTHLNHIVLGPAPAAAATIDALGCPTSQTCSIRQIIDPTLRSALLRLFPTASVQTGEQTYARSSGRIYRSWLLSRIAPNTTITQTAQCVPGGAVGTASSNQIGTGHVSLSGDTVFDRDTLIAIEPGAAGCSAAVYLQAPTDSFVLAARLHQLAADPTVELTP
jgi:hypothetical protein